MGHKDHLPATTVKKPRVTSDVRFGRLRKPRRKCVKELPPIRRRKQ